MNSTPELTAAARTTWIAGWLTASDIPAGAVRGSSTSGYKPLDADKAYEYVRAMLHHSTLV
ncbi:hypothetical protein M4D81_19110 [Paenibacillus sp. p3-SID867]|nr:hypothetical protein [Paenibacillus sp. p3-SID867]MCT1401138.1 hypothetical protein [Paenibacillus sp. p3-SID867]